MKTCPSCNQSYNDDAQNFCLNDGALLNKINDDAPPTVFLDPPRVTNETNWQNAGPVSPWQNQTNIQNQGFAGAPVVFGKDQTLPTVSLVFGILSIVLLCCYGGFPLGLVALITGYIGLKNEKDDSMKYGGHGMAVGGIVTGAVGIVLSIVLFIVYIFATIAK